MRARILFGGLLPVALAACSEPAARPALERKVDATLSTHPDLALSAAPGADVPVASNLELNLPKPKPERPRIAKLQKLHRKVMPVASEPVAQPVTEPAEVDVPHDPAVRPDSAPPVIATAMPPKIEEEPRASGPPVQPNPGPSTPSAGGQGTPGPDDIVDGRRPAHGPGVIIVRGGDGGGYDPCRIHGSGRGDIGGDIGGMIGGGIGGPADIGIRAGVGRGVGGVMINDRTPRIGGGYPRGGIR